MSGKFKSQLDDLAQGKVDLSRDMVKSIREARAHLEKGDAKSAVECLMGASVSASMLSTFATNIAKSILKDMED